MTERDPKKFDPARAKRREVRDAASAAAMSPIGPTHRAASSGRSQRSALYRDDLRRIGPYAGIARIVIARRQALTLTQQQLAQRAATGREALWSGTRELQGRGPN